MADPVEHHLRDRALAVQRLGRRLVIDGGGQAIERAQPVGGAGDGDAERAAPPDWRGSAIGIAAFMASALLTEICLSAVAEVAAGGGLEPRLGARHRAGRKLGLAPRPG